METHPIITLQKAVVFPNTTIPLVLEGKDSVATLNEAVKNNHQLVLNFTQTQEGSKIGVLAQVIQFWHLTPEIMGATLEVQKRVRVLQVKSEKGVMKADIINIDAIQEESPEVIALARNVFHQYNEVIKLEGALSPLGAMQLQDSEMAPDKLADAVAAALRLDYEEKLHLLETVDTRQRLEILNQRLAKELDIAKAEEVIQKDVAEELGKAQREVILRERLKAIEKELGIAEEREGYADLENKIRAAGMPKEIEDKALRELSRLQRMPAISPEAPYISTYLEIMADLPWSKKTESSIDLKNAREVLDSEHYGLEKVKERILEYLAVQEMTGGKARGNILSFVGPPGVGKTSVGESIANALGRKFVRVSLGGIRDESEIRGHRRTYVGAMPGRIIEGIRDAGTKNPVFMMDEIDKVGASFQGDPAAALLEVLDPAQNNSFEDHYLDVPFDLSDVFFITTANVVDTIPPALRDRMETIEFTGYTNEEKLHIAKQFLLPKVIADTGLNRDEFSISDNALMHIITKYTRESGVRELNRKISQVARRVAKDIIEAKNNPRGLGNLLTPGVMKHTVTPRNLAAYLGPEEFQEMVREGESEIGVATGMAWTPVGGEVIYIEASIVPGKQNLTLTGQLGDVMKESAQAALTFVRSQSKELGFNPEFYKNSDIHVHVPAGAVAKDGPSAGVAIATALASAITERKVRRDVAMTGEITLRGKVLPVGGIKEKVVAAYRAGAKTVILPKMNEKDMIDVPDEAKKNMDFIFIKTADEAFRVALINNADA